jgi:hypothetical protein
MIATRLKLRRSFHYLLDSPLKLDGPPSTSEEATRERMITKCLNWARESAKRADAYYRAMTAWATSRGTVGGPQILLKLADAYRRSLDKAIGCFQRLRPAHLQAETEIATAENYKKLLLDDIKVLSALDKRT